MKKQIVLAALAIIFSLGSVFAQDMQRQTPEERTKATMEKLAPLSLTADQSVKVNTAFLEFYTARQKSMEEMRAAGSFDREAMTAKNKELSDARDGKLKAVLTEDQLKKWKEEIEPSLRPQRKQQ
ncbi:MAG: hypothetical protein JWQ27_1498 [Ferruginibacter sp.]|nr:hypothetical protein [Ferruginibacter sp.]